MDDSIDIALRLAGNLHRLGVPEIAGLGRIPPPPGWEVGMRGAFLVPAFVTGLDEAIVAGRRVLSATPNDGRGAQMASTDAERPRWICLILYGLIRPSQIQGDADVRSAYYAGRGEHFARRLLSLPPPGSPSPFLSPSRNAGQLLREIEVLAPTADFNQP